MIYEVRTYRLKPHTVPKFIEEFGKAYEHRKKISELAGFFFSEIGPLNQVIHVWPYEDAAEREKIRAESVKGGNWPPKVTEYQEHMTTEIFTPWPFTPTMATGKHGPIYEWRSYMIRPGGMQDMMDSWASAIDERMKLSTLVMAMQTESGELNKFVHIWAYESLQHRAEVRQKAVDTGIWPPKGAPHGTLVQQENKILLPAPFSPLQ